MAKQLKYDVAARESIMKGVDQLAFGRISRAAHVIVISPLREILHISS